MILWRQDWFVIERFKWLAEDTYLFPDAREHAQLVAAGAEALKANDIDKLRAVVAHLASIRIGSAGEDRSEEHTSELQSLMRISNAVFCLKKQNNKNIHTQHNKP